MYYSVMGVLELIVAKALPEYAYIIKVDDDSLVHLPGLQRFMQARAVFSCVLPCENWSVRIQSLSWDEGFRV
jgi:hypothetical protein